MTKSIKSKSTQNEQLPIDLGATQARLAAVVALQFSEAEPYEMKTRIANDAVKVAQAAIALKLGTGSARKFRKILSDIGAKYSARLVQAEGPTDTLGYAFTRGFVDMRAHPTKVLPLA